MEYEDSTTTMFSEILPASGKRFRFEYEYDFGDGWLHEVLFEGRLKSRIGEALPALSGRGTGLPTRGRGWGHGLCRLP